MGYTGKTTTNWIFYNVMKKIMLLTVALVFLCGIQSASSLTIIRDFSNLGTAPTNTVGGGNIVDIFNAACDVWEHTILDPFTITLECRWDTNGGGQHVLTSQGGTPNRETSGIVSFNNDNDPNHFMWYLDPTPLTCLEATNYSEQVVGYLGAGPINASRCYRWSATSQHMDLFTAALHEIGHALGLGIMNMSFVTEAMDQDIDITGTLFPGMTVPLQHNNAGVIAHIGYVADRTLMSGSYSPGERVLPSMLDLVTLAQVSGWEKLNLCLVPKLHMSTTCDNGITSVNLSWTPLIPAPTGKQYVVESSCDLSPDSWTRVNCPIISSNGVSTMTMPATETKAFFRLIAADLPPVGVGLRINSLVVPQPFEKATRTLD